MKIASGRLTRELEAEFRSLLSLGVLVMKLEGPPVLEVDLLLNPFPEFPFTCRSIAVEHRWQG